ncbi:unnamed protein product [Brassica oleracea var. botrytis]
MLIVFSVILLFFYNHRKLLSNLNICFINSPSRRVECSKEDSYYTWYQRIGPKF